MTIDLTPPKPWPKMTPDEKAELALRTAAKMSDKSPESTLPRIVPRLEDREGVVVFLGWEYYDGGPLVWENKPVTETRQDESFQVFNNSVTTKREDRQDVEIDPKPPVY